MYTFDLAILHLVEIIRPAAQDLGMGMLPTGLVIT